MPKLGVDMQEGEIIEWKKQEGDVVNEGAVSYTHLTLPTTPYV